MTVQALRNDAGLPHPLEPYQPAHPIAGASICRTPIAAVTLSIDQLERWQKTWSNGHADHLLTFSDSGTNQCGCRPENLPKCPSLTVTAPTGKFITVAQYIQEVLPWLESLREEIRIAIGGFQGPLELHWDLVPIPLINRISIHNNNPEYRLDGLNFSLDHRAKIVQRMKRDQEVEKHPNLVGATTRSALTAYPSGASLQRTARATGNYDELTCTLEFHRLYFKLSPDDISEAVRFVNDLADFTLENPPSVPFTYDSNLAAASLSRTTLSSTIVSVPILDQEYESWHEIHYRHLDFGDLDEVPEQEYSMRYCSECDSKAPRPGPGPRLLVQAPSLYESITIADYVKEVYPWLRALEPRIREAFRFEVREPLAPQWDIFAYPQISSVDTGNNEPRYGLESLKFMRRSIVMARRRRSMTPRTPREPGLDAADSEVQAIAPQDSRVNEMRIFM